MRKSSFAFLIMLIMFFPASAQIMTIMEDTRFLKGPMENIAIITQIHDEQLRQDVGQSLVSAFHNKGVDAVNADDFMIPDSMFYYSTLEREFNSAGVDGILIVKIVDAEDADMYIYPGDVLAPDAYNYYEYYSVFFYYDLPIISAPAYYQREDIAFRIDFNLYQNKGDMIIWCGQSKQIDPNGLEKIIKGMGKKLVKTLVSNKLVRKN